MINVLESDTNNFIKIWMVFQRDNGSSLGRTKTLKCNLLNKVQYTAYSKKISKVTKARVNWHSQLTLLLVGDKS